MNIKEKVPVTILTGYLGSGKTTVLNELLKYEGKRSERIAIIVNDMGSVNIDASLIQSSHVWESDISMVELSNGCICCTLRDSFMQQINEIAAQRKVDRILVEASGISDPSSIAAGFIEYQEMKLCSHAYLDSVVCVVDAQRIYLEFLDELNAPMEAAQDPDILNLVIDQIEFCNIILLNKCDLLPPSAIEEVRKTIRIFQKDAIIYDCINGQVHPNKIFDGRKFDYEKVLLSSRVQEQLSQGRCSEIQDTHGITSFLFEDKHPFDRDKFMAFLEDFPEEIIRSKGYMWFADDDIHVQLFEQAGRNASVTEVSNWLAAFDEAEQQQTMQAYPEIMADWDAQYGDRLNQIVFIGKKMDPQLLTARLRDCLYDAQQEVNP